ncbi:MAG: response regulator [Desulfatibacillaceae bacterium]
MEKLVLIVEDSESNRQLLKDLLEKVCHCRVETAGDGQEAVDKALADPPDLILMDVGLPVMDGIEATENIKKSDQCGAVPVLALTGYASSEDERRLMEAGFDGFLAKPFDVPELLARLKGYLETRNF